MAHILPHWNWPDRFGKVTPVHVYTSGDEAELFINGKSLGSKHKDLLQYRLRWDDVTYEPGELKVVTYKDGKRWAEDVVRTTGKASMVELIADKTTIKSDGRDLIFVTVRIEDKDGMVVPTEGRPIHFRISGPAIIIAVGNGDAADHDSFQSDHCNSFHGLCMVIVKSIEGRPGQIVLSAHSDGLTDGQVEVSSR
jgi:beta-galactosidase